MENKVPDATAPDAVNVRLQFDEQNATGFAYDAESATYKMLHADGTPQLDASSGQQAAFDNLLVLFSASALRDDEQTFDYDLSMGGRASGSTAGTCGTSPGRRAPTPRSSFTMPTASC